MAEQFEQDLLEKILEDVKKRIENNKVIQELLKKIEKGSLSYQDADRYAVEVGKELGNAFYKYVSDDILPEGKLLESIAEVIIPEPLRYCSDNVANYALEAQAIVNKNAGLGIKPIKPDYNYNKEAGLIKYITSGAAYSQREKSFIQDLSNNIQSVVTDTLKVNMEFQYRSGREPIVKRFATGKCCAWCAERVGVYKYSDVNGTGNKVWQRHRDCRCTIIWEGNGRRDVVYNGRRAESEREKEDRIARRLIGVDTESITPEERVVNANRNIQALPSPVQIEFISEIENFPKILGTFTPEMLYNELKERGFDVTPLARGKLRGIDFNSGGGYKVNYSGNGLLQYHPEEGSHHGGAYYKISNSKQGIKWYTLNGDIKVI